MKTWHLFALVVVALLVMASPVMAQQPATSQTYVLSGASLGAGLGAGLILVGAGYGFGKIGTAGLESMARQPEKAGQIQIAMIIIGALLEGATLIALLLVTLPMAGRPGF
jgi:F-type H+-transporting ATPase subunit c